MRASFVADVFPGGELTRRLARLFWFRSTLPNLADPQDALQALATILTDGSPSDWAELNMEALCHVIDDVPLFGSAEVFWRHFCNREVGLLNPADRVIGPDHHAILAVAADVLAPYSFELAGGTALAAGYLGHRKSDDLDFFALGNPNVGQAFDDFSRRLTQLGMPPQDVDRVTPTFTRATVRGVTVELDMDSPFRIEKSAVQLDGMPLRSLPDLAADKTLALFGRATTRDFVDVYQLIRTHYDLSELMELAAQKDRGFDKGWFAKALVRARAIDPKDVTMLVPLDFTQMRTQFLDAASRLLADRNDNRHRDDGLDR